MTEPTLAPRPPLTGGVFAGLAGILALLAGLGGWAALAPLSSAAVARGTVVVEHKRKTVQHLEGGIVGRILVAEGARVAAGQPLLLLDDTQARARFQQLRAEQEELLAERARLLAERDGAAAISFPAELEAGGRGALLAAGQRRLFEARRDRLAGQRAILGHRLAQLDAEAVGLDAQIAAAERQRGLIEQERGGVAALVAQGFEKRTRLLALERDLAQLEGSRGANLAALARLRQRRGETELELVDLDRQRAEEVARELRETQARLGELGEKLAAAADVLTRTVIAAPIAGVAMDLRVHTAGGVIEPGQPLLDILPEGEALLIEARLDPLDIDDVHRGLPAQVRLAGLKRNAAPVLAGRVDYLSADELADKDDHRYFLARIAIPAAEAARLGVAGLMPGMPAEVTIVTGERTALDYLLEPVRASFGRAFRER